MDDGSLWNISELSHPYRNQTRDYVQHCLDLGGDLCLDSVKPVSATICAFETIGTAISKAYNHGTSGSISLLLDVVRIG